MKERKVWKAEKVNKRKVWKAKKERESEEGKRNVWKAKKVKEREEFKQRKKRKRRVQAKKEEKEKKKKGKKRKKIYVSRASTSREKRRCLVRCTVEGRRWPLWKTSLFGKRGRVGARSCRCTVVVGVEWAVGVSSPRLTKSFFVTFVPPTDSLFDGGGACAVWPAKGVRKESRARRDKTKKKQGAENTVWFGEECAVCTLRKTSVW